MTNKDAVKVFKSWVECLSTDCDNDCEHCHLQIDLNAVSEACAIAITELSQIDDDTVSRKAVLDAIMGEPTDAHYPSWYAERIKALPPSPTPSRPHIASLETPCDDCDVADKCTYESNCPREAIWKAEHEGGAV